jgi:probable rRNA maturation factor
MTAPADSTPVLASEHSEDTEPPERFDAEVVEEAGDWSAIEARNPLVARIASTMEKHPSCARLRGRSATVVLADNELVRALNRTYRHKDTPTNVLSFPFGTSPDTDDAGHLGDVVLALETVLREAADQGLPPEHHFQHLVVHGLLHLIGFDHEAEEDAIKMEQLETRILGELGIPDPYALMQSD